MAYDQYNWSGKPQAGYNPMYNPSGSAQNTSGTSFNTQQAFAQKLDPAAAQFAQTVSPMGPASTNYQMGPQTPTNSYPQQMGPQTNSGYEQQKIDMGAGSYGGSKDVWANNAAQDNIGVTPQVTAPQVLNNSTPQVFQNTPQTNNTPMLGPNGPGSVTGWDPIMNYADAFRRPLMQGQQTMAPTGSAPPGNFTVLPNFDQNGRIISIPQGVNYSVPIDGGAPAWNYQGYTQTAQPIPGFGDPAAGVPIGQYTGGMPTYTGSAQPWLGVGAFRA